MPISPNIRRFCLVCFSTPILAVAAATPTLAQSAQSDFSISANAAIVTDYRFRGLSLSEKDPAIQGGFDVSHKSGFYAGTWGSSIQPYGGSEFEMDLYAGYSSQIGSLSTDIGILAYNYPGSDNTHYIEAYGSVGGTVASTVSWTLGAAYVWEQENTGNQDNIYLYLDGSMPIADTPLSLTGHIAYEDGAFGNEKWDWNLGVTYSYKQYSFSVSYVDTNSSSSTGDAAAVAMLSASF